MNDNLPLLMPDAARSARTVARCHDALARRQRRVEAATRARAKALLVERLLVAGLSVVYLIAMANDLVNLYW